MARSKYSAEQVVTGALAWCKKIAEQKKYIYVYWNGKYGHECAVCHPHGGANKGWQCIGFITACYHHGGGLRGFVCNCAGLGGDDYFNTEPSTKSWNRRNGPGWKRITTKKVKATSTNLKNYCKPGDVLILYSKAGKGGYKHLCMYWSYDSKNKYHLIAESSGGYVAYNHKRKSISDRYMHVYRFVGPGSARDAQPYSNKNIITPGITGTTTIRGLSGKRPVINANTKNGPRYICVKKAGKHNSAEVRNGAVDWALDVAYDNRFHYGYGSGAHHNGCYWCGQISKKPKSIKMRNYTYCCNPFVNAAYAHGGGDATALKNCKNHGSWDFHEGHGYDKLASEGRLFKKISNPDVSKLLPGDVGCCSTHVKMYVGRKNGKHYIVHACHTDDNKVGSNSWNTSIKVEKLSSCSGYRWYRYIGTGTKAMYRREDCVGTTGSTATSSERWDGTVVDDGSPIVLEKEISKLYSSDNYEFIDIEYNKESEETRKFRENIQKLVEKTGFKVSTDSNATSESIVPVLTNSTKYIDSFEKNKVRKLKDVKTEELISYPNFVQAPTIVLDFNGTKIGGYGNKGDLYPNYITSMSIKKINGRINQYTFNLTYQIRPNEDPNFIDKLLSKTGYRNKLKILYGDSAYNRGYIKEEDAIITGATHKEDVSSAKIDYTITALSSLSAAMKITQDYDSKIDKPSNQLYSLLYDSGEVSESLLSVFTGMKDRTSVMSNNLIPTNDAVVKIGGLEDSNPVDYISTLVGCMTSSTNEISSYYLSYYDDNKMDGPYFKVTEVKKVSDLTSISSNSVVYTIDVGYPTNNFVTNFQVCNNDYWPLTYKFAGDIPAYEYDLDKDGNVSANKINLLTKSQKYNNSGLVEENWWKQVTEFPISAKLTLKGLVAPIMLMSYIEVNVLFYGKKDLASGLYVVTEQNDTISGSGYTTELTLLRVAED